LALGAGREAGDGHAVAGRRARELLDRDVLQAGGQDARPPLLAVGADEQVARPQRERGEVLAVLVAAEEPLAQGRAVGQ
jgi:hypothetical protein